MSLNELEHNYEFNCELADGTFETFKIPRVSTRLKFKLGLMTQKKDEEITIDELTEFLLEQLCPDLMDRAGDKSLTLPSLGLLIAKIIEVDGDSIFGKEWRKNLPRIPKKGVKKSKKAKKKTAK